MRLTPRIALYAVGVVVCAIALLSLIAFASDPFGFKSRKIERLEREAQAAQSEALARTLESEGRSEQITRIESAGRLTIDVNTIAAEAVLAAQVSKDANIPLEAGLLDRLRQFDNRLCDLRPAACRPTLDAAGNGNADVSAPPPAR